ncbi:MAG: pantetheine-phosphate adenylyltransferase [Promethearchaeota archaeon]
MKKAIIAGSFDPITFGHIDIMKRAANVFDQLVVGIGVNPDKKYTFSLEERKEMVHQSLSAFPEVSSKVKIVYFQGLLVDYAYENRIPVIVKGVRDEKDLDYELTLFQVGESQKPGVDTFLLPARQGMTHISSSSVKALQKEQGLVHEYVPLYVKQCLEARLSGQYIIGITGGICTGKSYIGKKFEELGNMRGIPVHNIELDYIPHRMYDGTLKEPIYVNLRRKIVDTFGKEVELPDGSINRRALGEIVFGNSQKLEKLNELVYEPLMIALRREMYAKKGLILLNAALIAEAEMIHLSNNNVVLVSADKQSQERRLKERNLAKEQIERRLASQYTKKEKSKKIEAAISEHKQGKLWTIDNSDGADPSKIAVLFDEIIKYIDQYGELRFRGLWERIGADGTPDAEYQRLLEAYSQSHRVYHSLPHIVRGLDEHAEAKHLMEHPDQVLFAWWYHDFVMQRKSRVDEERSAQIAYNVCKNALLPDDFAENVKTLILATKHHDMPTTIDGKYIVDIDLAIFGRSVAEFDNYEESIRVEYQWTNPEEFRSGRIAVLERFLNRPTIYYTDFFRNKYDTQARRNLEQSLKKLRKDITS